MEICIDRELRRRRTLISWLLISVWFLPVGAFAESSNQGGNNLHCPQFQSSVYYTKPVTTTMANPENWVDIVNNARAGEHILLEDGTYLLEQYAIVFNKPVTFRGASGDRTAVIIEGKGMSEYAEALMVMSDDVIIADLTIKNVRDHGISIKEGFARTIVYNVELTDIGTQHIKGNRSGPDGVIACSKMGYSTDISIGDYNGAIDLHAAVHWLITDNYIYNIYGDGSGCAVDEECDVYFPGGEPAILLWQGSRDNIIQRNTIVESFRAISLGLDTEYSGGVVADNHICRSVTGKEGVNGFIAGDTGISLIGASNVVLSGNRVELAGEYQGPIEVKDGAGIIAINNQMTKTIWNRGNAEVNGCTQEKCKPQRFGNVVVERSSISCPTSTVAPLLVASSENKSTVEVAPLKEVAKIDLQSAEFDQEIASLTQQLAARTDRQPEIDRLEFEENQQIMRERIRILETRQNLAQLQLDIVVRRLEEIDKK